MWRTLNVSENIMAIIKLIEKKRKDKMYIKKWRPIDLLNADVKIASKAVSKRLETFFTSHHL